MNSPIDIRRVSVVVSGTVQGVGFRRWTEKTARELHLAGWVRNSSDGSVETELEGPPAVVDAMLERLRVGPRLAIVRDVRIVELIPRHDDGEVPFTVR